MTSMRLWASLLELSLMIVLSGVVVTIIYRIIVKVTREFDLGEELRSGNVAIGVLLAAIMLSIGLMLQRGMGASVETFRLALAAPEAMATPIWQAGLLFFAHLFVTLVVSVVTLTITLRFFKKLTLKFDPKMNLVNALREGNVAVAVFLAAVVFIITAYVGDGVSSVTRSLVPQPKIGKIQIME